MITPAIKHDHLICTMPVFPAKVDHALLYLVAGVIRTQLVYIRQFLLADKVMGSNIGRINHETTSLS